MKKNLLAISISILFIVVGHYATSAESRILFDFGDGATDSTMESNHAMVDVVHRGDQRALRVRPIDGDWPGVTLKALKGKWDLSSFRHLAIGLRNVGRGELKVFCRVDNSGADGTKNCVTESMTLGIEESATLLIPFQATRWRLSSTLPLIGMRGHPGGATALDLPAISQIVLFVPKAEDGCAFEINSVRAGGETKLFDGEKFLPIIDSFGQFRHGKWPGKVDSLEELAANRDREDQDLLQHPGPPQTNRYGGWTVGPQLEATGFFRVQKHQGAWWFVDPDGRLFWSHGIDCVHANAPTPISDRESYFEDLPAKEDALGRFYGHSNWAPHGYYADHRPYRTFDFASANLRRKYGREWYEEFADRSHRRLRSWGLNTIGNWSDHGIARLRRTPYVASIHHQGEKLEGSKGYWSKFYDVFDPSFRAGLAKSFARFRANGADDPWCIGFFVDNELSWGDELSLAEATLRSPASQFAKQTLAADLKSSYGSIEHLNQAWGANHASWKSFLKSQSVPNSDKSRNDLRAFSVKTCDTYFRVVREVLKNAAPNQLYLGCRFAWANDVAVEAAAKYCDVICYNQYKYSVENFQLPQGIDRPIIIGEFHFGALDRGMFHTGLRRAANQEHRAQLFADYVRGALRNRAIVGTHWFQFRDQATTGRGDGENYQIGLLDICDTPYSEMINACREVGYRLYSLRLNANGG